jgi:predicted AlkP superfamily pyrophosphatase or phosphodiesterase
MPLGQNEIRHRFGYHKGTPDTASKHEAVRQAYIAIGEFLDQTIPDGRAKSTAFTKLQESSMWANFGVAEQAPLVPMTGDDPKPVSPAPKPRPPKTA